MLAASTSGCSPRWTVGDHPRRERVELAFGARDDDLRAHPLLPSGRAHEVGDQRGLHLFADARRHVLLGQGPCSRQPQLAGAALTRSHEVVEEVVGGGAPASELAGSPDRRPLVTGAEAGQVLLVDQHGSLFWAGEVRRALGLPSGPSRDDATVCGTDDIGCIVGVGNRGRARGGGRSGGRETISSRGNRTAGWVDPWFVVGARQGPGGRSGRPAPR